MMRWRWYSSDREVVIDVGRYDIEFSDISVVVMIFKF